MPIPDDPFVFVSYSSKDGDFVHPEIRRLEREGYRIWYDKGELQPGRFWNDEIRRAIKACACFMVFITQDALDSRNVCDELDQALEAGKPFICVYWEKVELPPRFQQPIRSIQALERYSLRRFEYEGPLSRALSEYVKRIEFQSADKDDKPEEVPAPPPPPDTPLTALPKIVFFILVLSSSFFFLFAAIMMVIPYFASTTPGDPLNNRLAGFLTGLFFIGVALVVGVAAFAVQRVYLRRRNG
jgi:hypothetical protein